MYNILNPFSLSMLCLQHPVEDKRVEPSIMHVQNQRIADGDLIFDQHFLHSRNEALPDHVFIETCHEGRNLNPFGSADLTFKEIFRTAYPGSDCIRILRTLLCICAEWYCRGRVNQFSLPRASIENIQTHTRSYYLIKPEVNRTDVSRHLLIPLQSVQ